MSWILRFAEIWRRSPSVLAVVQGWLSEAFAMISSPARLEAALHSQDIQRALRGQLRLIEAMLRIAIMREARAVSVPALAARAWPGQPKPGTAWRRLAPSCPYRPRFRLSCTQSRWSSHPPRPAPRAPRARGRKPKNPAALLCRLLAAQDGVDRFEALAKAWARKHSQRSRSLPCQHRSPPPQRPPQQRPPQQRQRPRPNDDAPAPASAGGDIRVHGRGLLLRFLDLARHQIADGDDADQPVAIGDGQMADAPVTHA